MELNFTELDNLNSTSNSNPYDNKFVVNKKYDQDDLNIQYDANNLNMSYIPNNFIKNISDKNQIVGRNKISTPNLQKQESVENTQKYWEMDKKEPKKKAKFGYDDILSSLNLVVNDKGVLQYMSGTNTPNDNSTIPQNHQNSQNYQHSQNHQNHQNQSPLTQTYNQQVKHAVTNPNIKNSYIFNKYFKNFKEPTEVEERKIPKTPEEYRQMVIEDYVKRVQAQKRIEQVKSRKIAYTNGRSIGTSQKVSTLNSVFNR